MTTEPLILCENLVKIYRLAGLEVQALQGLDLAVARGELLGVVGASGSGKSTLMNILGGLDRPTAGRARVGRHDLLTLRPWALDRYRRSTVGFVWQHGARNLIAYLSARENVELPMTLANVPARESRRRAEELLALVGLADRAGHKLAQLSGGEQQRAAIAVALANRPELLLADEPTGELDSATARAIYQVFRDLNTQLGLTTLIVSHDPGIAEWVDRVVAVRDGKFASETVRQAGGAGHAVFHVLDSAGRLQLPADLREQYGIGRRVRIERHDDGILIRPAADDPPAA